MLGPLGRRPRLTAAAVAACVLLPTAAAAQAAPSPEEVAAARDRVATLDREISDAERQRDGARAELEALETELSAASHELEDAEADLEDARAAADEARTDAAAVLARLSESQDRLDAARDRLASFARNTYKYGLPTAAPAMAAFEQLATPSDLADLAETMRLLERILGDRGSLVTESADLVAATARLADQARRAEARQAEQTRIADAAWDRAATLHARVLELTDAASEAYVREQENNVRLRQQRSDAQVQVDDLEAQARAAAEARARAAAEAAGTLPVPSAGGDLVTVGGITVAAPLGAAIAGLLDAARADGIVLGGSGWRSPETTARLRIANGCPDVHTSPSSSCRVPTARPGSSMHERGAAIDFTWRGRTICYPNPGSSCRGNRAYDWLVANAGRFGLVNLRTEAWHWSINGR